MVTIFSDPDKLDMDILMPVLSPILERKRTLAEEIEALELPAPRKSASGEVH